MTQTPENQQQYGSILTILGENAEQNGKLQNKQISFTHIAIGDANDTYVQPGRGQTALVNELARVQVNSVDVLQPTPDSVPMLKVEAILPDHVNDLVIREFAAVAEFNGQTYFHAVGNCARIYVPPPVNNGNVLTPVTLEMIFVITSAEPIIEIDPNVVTASREWAGHQDHQTLEQSSNLKVYPLNKNLSVGDTVPAGHNGLRIKDRVYRISCSGKVEHIDANGTYIIVDGKKRYLQPCLDGQKLYSIDNLINYPLSDWGEKINYAAEICREDSLTLWIPNNIYKFNTTIELRDIDVQWDGKLELCTNTIGIILNYNVNLKGNPRIIRSKDLEHFDQTMVLLTSPGSIVGGSSKTKGCVENKIEQLQILNGWIDYDSHDHGVVIDISKMTGRGLMLLAGSWILGLTSIRTHEFVWRNYINDVFVDGFAYPYVLQAVIDDIDPNRWTTWVNGNKLRCLGARRFKKALTVISPLMKPNLEIGGEVAGNTCSELDFQWSNDTSECFLECSGRGNKFEFMGWDGPKDGQATIRFIRNNDFPDGYAEAAGNIVELYGSTAKELNGSDLSPFVYEDNPGLNTFIANGATTKNLIPEEAPPTVGSALTRSYIPKVDNFFAFINTRPKYEAKLYKNGVLQGSVDLTPMFDFNPESAVHLDVQPGDSYEVEISMRVSRTHFNMIGSTLGYKQFNSGRVLIELKGAEGEEIYSSSQSLKTSNVTGFINAPNVKTIRLVYSDFDAAGQLNITSIYGKTYNFNSSSGIMTADGECWMEADVKINKQGSGLVLRDRHHGGRFRLYIENGEIKTEPYVL
ncbi:phage tail protein [Vibrio alginolyticus]